MPWTRERGRAAGKRRKREGRDVWGKIVTSTISMSPLFPVLKRGKVAREKKKGKKDGTRHPRLPLSFYPRSVHLVKERKKAKKEKEERSSSLGILHSYSYPQETVGRREEEKREASREGEKPPLIFSPAGWEGGEKEPEKGKKKKRGGEAWWPLFLSTPFEEKELGKKGGGEGEEKNINLNHHLFLVQ